MRRRSYLVTGLMVGATLGALASPRTADSGAKPAPGEEPRLRITAEEEAERGAIRNELALGVGAATQVSLELPVETIPPAKVAAATTPTTSPAAVDEPAPGTENPGSTTTTVAAADADTDAPPPTVGADAPVPSTPTPTPTPTTPTPPPRSRCTLIQPAAAKLDLPAELAPRLEAGSVFDVVVALEAPQSTSPQLEQQLRVASLANFTELGVDRFTTIDATRVQVRLSSGQICRLAYLRPVVGLQVRLPAG